MTATRHVPRPHYLLEYRVCMFGRLMLLLCICFSNCHTGTLTVPYFVFLSESWVEKGTNVSLSCIIFDCFQVSNYRAFTASLIVVWFYQRGYPGSGYGSGIVLDYQSACIYINNYAYILICSCWCSIKELCVYVGCWKGLSGAVTRDLFRDVLRTKSDKPISFPAARPTCNMDAILYCVATAFSLFLILL